MTGSKPSYPQPGQDKDNEAFLTAWRAGRLMLQHCQACGRSIFYPRAICPYCWSDALLWKEAQGRGTVSSFSLVRRPNDAAFFDEVPIILAEVHLAEGATMIARLIASDPGVVAIGAEVVLVDAAEAKRYPLPTFRCV